MKNLELFEISRETIEDSYNNVSHIAFTKECVYALKNSHLTVYNRDSGEILHTFEEPFKSITDLEILTIENILWFGTGDEFVYVNIENNELHKIQTCESFTAAAWNPAQDSIAIVSTNREIGVYRVDYEDNLVIPIETSDLSSTVHKDDFINVGWGSVNTQFRGTAGKLSSVVQESEEAVAVQNKAYPQISWRGNGEMFVVIFNDIKETKFLVFQYPCTLIHQSVPVVGLQPIIAWSPEGNKIASFVWTTKKCELTIFEKNGLFRSSFALFRKENVKEIKWNPSGNILAIRQEDDQGFTTIDIYYVKNYVWYLKQRLNFQSNTLIQYEFLSLTSVCSLRVTTKYESVTYTFKFVVSNSCISYNDEGLVCASINGNELYMTNCKEGIKPPPMCDFVATMNVPISFVIFHPDKPKLAVVDCANLIKIFEIENDHFNLLGEFQLKYDDNLLIPLKFHHFVWKSDTEIICVVERSEENKCLSSLFVLKMTDEWQLVIEEAEIEKDVSYIEYIKSSDTLLLQKCNALSQVVGGGVTEDGIILQSLVLYRKSIVIDDELYIFSLTSTDKFYVNLEEVLEGEGVISFILHDGYLLLTTQRHNLMCVRLNKQSILEFCQLKFENIYSRSIEQGSYLLFGIPNTSYVVMQMPRGNVEMCACRMISMHRIESLIKDQKWNLALDLVRIEKLSTDVLVDLDVDRFVSGVPQFVKSIQTPSIINEFLLGLQEENVLITLYKNCGIAPPKQVTNKLEVIGNALINFMIEHNYLYYISTIVIGCFIKNSGNSIGDALQHIQNLLHSNSVKVAEEAFKSIYTLKPNAKVYQKALEMYDLDLAVFVAKHIQMDPKEYKPFINNLKNLDPIRCRFEINTSLKHYDMAVKYLIRYSEDKNEILSYIKEHSVYKSAYECLDLNSSLFSDVTRIYAEELSKQRLYDESATLYERAGLNKLALEEYKKALLWEQAIVLLKQEQVHITEYNEHLYEIINNLKKQGRILEACEIYEKYLDDYETSAVLLAENKLFSRALNLVKKYKRNDIYQSDIALALKEYCSDLSSKFQSMHETFLKYKERLSVVRSKKVQKLTAAMHYDNRFNFNSQQPNYEDDICSIADTVASTTSMRSTSSRSSTMSSRHRRKEERKKEDLREGGFYEDIALMKALHQLIQEAFQLGPQIRQLCLSIISYGQNVTIDIKEMHNLLIKLQEDMKFGIKEIWPLNINNVKAIEDPNASIIYANVDVLDVKYRSPPEGLNTSWKLTLI